MPAELTLASANVQCDLPGSRAAEALRLVLERSPDLVGLQEWSLRRLGLLARTGRVRLLLGVVPVPLPGPLPVPLSVPLHGLHPVSRPGRSGSYAWCAPVLGGCAVGWRAERFLLVSARSVALSLPGRADRHPGQLGLEPGRVASVVTLRERGGDRLLSLVDYHLVYGVQHGRSYRTDRPVLVRRHQHERATLTRLVTTLLRSGHEVHALGDSNFAGMSLPGLISARQGETGPGRAIDDVFGPGVPTSVEAVPTPSDHPALVVTRER